MRNRSRCRRTETRPKRVFRGDLQESVQDLLHPALSPTILQTIDFLPVRLHVRPHQQLEPLHESVVARTASHRVRQILFQSSGL